MPVESDRYCFNCRANVGQQFFCPRCGQETRPARESAARAVPSSSTPLIASLPARIGFGVMFGTVLVLIGELVVRGIAAMTADSTIAAARSSIWVTAAGLIVAAFVAALIASAGDGQGGLCGALAAAGVFAVDSGRRSFAGLPVQAELFQAVPIVLVLGFLGGMFGGYFWRPLRPSGKFQPPKRIAEEQLVTAVPIEEIPEDRTDPVPWVRLLLFGGAAIVSLIENRRIARGSAGVLFPSVNLDLYAWILQVLTVVAAAWLVSRQRHLAVRNGLIVGGLLAVTLIGVHLVRDTTPPVCAVYYEWTARRIEPVVGLVLTAVGTAMLGTVTGWIAGQIQPPPLKPRSRPATA